MEDKQVAGTPANREHCGRAGLILWGNNDDKTGILTLFMGTHPGARKQQGNRTIIAFPKNIGT